MSRGSDVSPHKKGHGYLLGRGSYLTMNLYRVWWWTGVGTREEQVLALTVKSAKNKVSKRFKVRPTSLTARIVLRKGVYRPTGLQCIK